MDNFAKETHIKHCGKQLYIDESKVLQSISNLLLIHPKSHFRIPSPDRQNYSELIKWFRTQNQSLKISLMKKQINGYTAIEKQSQLFLMGMNKIVELSSLYCSQQSQLLAMFTKQQNYIYNTLKEQIEGKINQSIRDQLEKQIILDKQYEERIMQLEQQLKNVSFQKDKKWRNMFMLIKDNRIMRRQRGKILRQLKQCYHKQTKLEEQSIQMMRQNERYKLMLNDSYYEGKNFESWSKQILNLVHYQKMLKKYPNKAKKILQFDLEGLQIAEMKTINEKMEFILKAIEEADEIVQFYEDMNQIIVPSKLLLNQQAQTQIQTEQIATNTPIKKFTNTYIQIKKSQIAINSLSLNSKTNQIQFIPISNRMTSSLNKYKSNSSLKDFRCDKSQKSINRLKQKKNIKLSYASAYNMTLVYHYQTYFKNKDQDQKLGFQRRLRKLCIQSDSENQFWFNGKSLNKNSESRWKKYGRNSSSIQSNSLCEQSINDYQQNQNSNQKIIKRQRLSHNYKLASPNSKKRLSATVKSNLRFSIMTNNRSVDLQNINQIQEQKQISQIQQKQKNDSIKGWQITEKPDQQMINNEIQQLAIQLQSKNKAPKKIKNQKISYIEKINESHKINKLSESLTNRSSRNSNSSYNIFGHNYIQPSHTETLRKIVIDNSRGQIFLQEDNQSTSKENQVIHYPDSTKNVSQTRQVQSKQLQKTKKQLVKLTSSRYSVLNPIVNSLKNNKSISSMKKQRNSLMNQKGYSNNRSSFGGNRESIISHNQSFSKNKYVNDSIQEANDLAQNQINKANKTGRLHSKETRFSKNVQRTQTAPNFLQSQRQIVSSHIDVFKIVQKIIHLLYVHRVELRYSQRTLKQFIESNIKFLFGNNPESQFYNFNKLLALLKDPQPVIETFRHLLSFDYPRVYLNDLLKIYVIMLDKSGVESLVVQRAKALRIIQYILSMFYKKQKYERIIQELPYLDKSTTNLNQFFLSLNILIRKNTIQSELYIYLREILPENEIDLNSSEIQQLFKVLTDNIQTHKHLTRLKFYCKRDSKIDSNIGIKIHKISLYATLYDWDALRDIKATIRQKWQKINTTEEQSDPYKSKKDIEMIKSLRSSRKLKRFRVNLQNQLLHNTQCNMLLKNECPWLYSLAKKHIHSYLQYNNTVNDDFLTHLQIIEEQLQMNQLQILSSNLECFCELTKRIAEKQQIIKIISNQ